jgi:hypothetical protein
MGDSSRIVIHQKLNAMLGLNVVDPLPENVPRPAALVSGAEEKQLLGAGYRLAANNINQIVLVVHDSIAKRFGL